MDAKEIEQYRARAMAKKDAAIKRAEREYLRDIDAIERILLMSSSVEDPGSERSLPPSGTPTPGPLKRGAIMQAIRRIVDEEKGKFSVEDVESQLKQYYPDFGGDVQRATIRVALRRLKLKASRNSKKGQKVVLYEKIGAE